MHGLLNFASVVLQAPVGRYYAAMKFFRRRAAAVARGQMSANSEVHLWATARPVYEKWFTFLLRNEPVHPRQQGFRATNFSLFTDASKAGYGSVLVSNDTGLILSFGSAWDAADEAKHINTREALAVTKSVYHFSDYLTGANVHVFIDNTSAKGALERGYSRSSELNDAVVEALAALKIVNSVTASYVASEDNPSDPRSRGKFDWSAGEIIAATQDVSLASGADGRWGLVKG